ncbi:MAG: K(+)-transporting ATPase subunit C [Desulfobacterota bacterium]|nr:K(+)-transporting ATPase subunit C [Thermodesulfobacteriota bacterium]
MKNITLELRRALLATLALAMICSGLYPLAVWALAQVLFPDQANGSLIEERQVIRGSRLIAQGFSGPRYFHPRPSAAGQGYDGLRSAGSNLGPLSQTLNDALQERLARYRAENGLAPDVSVPADAVTASASGLDPHISLKNARLQAPRVAAARGVGPENILRQIEQYTEGRDWGLFGEPRVNVLVLNLALDRQVR